MTEVNAFRTLHGISDILLRLSASGSFPRHRGCRGCLGCSSEGIEGTRDGRRGKEAASRSPGLLLCSTYNYSPFYPAMLDHNLCHKETNKWIEDDYPVTAYNQLC